MDVYEKKLSQDRLNTEEFWKELVADVETENIFAVSEDQITETVKAKILTQEQGKELKNRRSTRIKAVRQESIQRYPVQIPEESAQKMYSDKYEEKMSESKRTKKQNRFGTALHRKKLNAEGIENAVSKHKNEKNNLLAKILNTAQTQYPAMLQGKSVNDIMSGSEISDRAEFLVDDKEHMLDNLNLLFGERITATAGEECVRQFMELDLSADLRTDKALAKDADRLEKVIGKARAMINLVDIHPEIKESMEPKEKFEFETKLKSAFTLVDYYIVRKDIITDKWYRNHENSEISTQFERRTEDNVSTPEKEQRYLEQQNLTRKIWTAERLANSVRQPYSPTFVTPFDIKADKKADADADPDAIFYSNAMKLYYHLKQTKSPAGEKKNSENKTDDQLREHSFKTDTKGQYFADHYKKDNPVYNAIIVNHNIAGTTDVLKDLNRNYIEFSNWTALDTLSDTEFTEMMDNFAAFEENVTADTPPAVIENIRNRELKALRIYKKAILGGIPHLKEKYGIGMMLESPQSIQEHQEEILNDIGNTQTITETMKIFRKYGILNDNDPADLEMEAVMDYVHASLTAANEAYSNVRAQIKSDKNVPSYTDMMKFELETYDQFMTQSLPSVVLRIRELEGNPGMNTKVSWEREIPDAIAKLRLI